MLRAMRRITLVALVLIFGVLGGLASSTYDSFDEVWPEQSTSFVPPPVMPSCSDISGQHLNYNGVSVTCGTSYPVLSGTTGSIGGSALLVGGCSSGTATVSGASVGQPVEVSPTDGTNIQALGVVVSANVTSSNTVTVNVCALLALTPSSKQYSVRVFP